MLSELEFARKQKAILLASFQMVIDECLELGLSKKETQRRVDAMLDMLNNVNQRIKKLESEQQQ